MHLDVISTPVSRDNQVIGNTQLVGFYQNMPTGAFVFAAVAFVNAPTLRISAGDR